MLRNGKRTNPSPDVLRALAKFFAVPVGYLLGDLSDSQAQRVEEEVRFLVAMRDKRVRGIALRSLGLPRGAGQPGHDHLAVPAADEPAAGPARLPGPRRQTARQIRARRDTTR
ncbi:hypothetical protein NKH77_03205 [Streptomyces sp. M19]